MVSSPFLRISLRALASSCHATCTAAFIFSSWNIKIFFHDFFEDVLLKISSFANDMNGLYEFYFSGCNVIYVVFDIFCIRSNNRAVVVIACIRELFALIRDTWIEDGVDALFDQPCNVSVGKFCRITLRLTRDGFNTKFVNLSGGCRRKYNDGNLSALKKCCPERISSRTCSGLLGYRQLRGLLLLQLSGS